MFIENFVRTCLVSTIEFNVSCDSSLKQVVLTFPFVMLQVSNHTSSAVLYWWVSGFIISKIQNRGIGKKGLHATSCECQTKAPVFGILENVHERLRCFTLFVDNLFNWYRESNGLLAAVSIENCDELKMSTTWSNCECLSNVEQKLRGSAHSFDACQLSISVPYISRLST